MTTTMTKHDTFIVTLIEQIHKAYPYATPKEIAHIAFVTVDEYSTVLKEEGAK
jgi:hypothetical protein